MKLMDERILDNIANIVYEDVFLDSADVFEQCVYEFSYISLLERELPTLPPSEAPEELGYINNAVIMRYALKLTEDRLCQDDVFWIRDKVKEWLDPMGDEEALEYLNYLMYECRWRPWA